jgi:hypothetical protein
MLVHPAGAAAFLSSQPRRIGALLAALVALAVAPGRAADEHPADCSGLLGRKKLARRAA